LNATASPTRQPVSRPRPDHPTKINGIIVFALETTATPSSPLAPAPTPGCAIDRGLPAVDLPPPPPE
jgi:hypothetical protein